MSQPGGGKAITKAVLRVLDGEPSRVFSIPDVHRELAIKGRNLRATARQLERMAERGQILSPYRGYFQSKRAEELPILGPSDIRFHAPSVLVECRKEGSWTPPQARHNAEKTPWHTLRRSIEDRFAFDRAFPENGGLRYRGEWEGFPLTVMLYPTVEKALVFLHDSSSRPLGLMDFVAYLRFWPNMTGVPAPFWSLKQIDANVDVRGVHAAYNYNRRISFMKAGELVAKWYQKEVDTLRLEARAQGDYPVDGILDNLREALRFGNVLRHAKEDGEP